MTKDRINIFLDDIYLISEIETLISDLEKIIDLEYTTGENISDFLEKNISYQTRDKILKTFEVNENTIHEVEKIVEELKDIRNSNLHAELTLAVEPSHELIKDLSLWLQNIVGKKVLMEIKYDRNIFAGVIIGFNGQYRNFTLRDYIKIWAVYLKNIWKQIKNMGL